MAKRAWISILLYCVLGCACLYGYLLLPGSTLSGMDFLNLIYPRGELIHRSFLAGRIPLWNSYEWGGCPILAVMQGSVLYPPAWPFLLVAQPYGLQLSIFFHVFWAAVGASLLARHLLKCGRAICVFAGLAYIGSGYLVGRIEQANVVLAFSWTPWLFLVAARFIEHIGSIRGLLLVIALGLLTGHPQTTALGLIACAVFIVSCIMLNGSEIIRWRERALALLRYGFAGAVAVAGASVVAAAQLLPTQELSALSERVWAYADPMEPALHWSQLPALVIPRYFHHLADVEFGKPLGYTELGLYCGVVTAPLFLWGAIVALRKRQAIGCALFVTWVFCMLFALGHGGGIAALFTKLIPFLEHSRGTARMLNSATLCYILIAAGGFQHAALKLSVMSPNRWRFVPYAIPLILLFDLCWTNWQELHDQRIDVGAATRISSFTSKLRGDGTHARLHRFMQNDSDLYLDNRPAIVPLRGERLQPNLTTVQGIRTMDGYEEALLPTRSWSNLLRRYNRNLRSDRVDARLLSLLGVTHMLSDYPIMDFGPKWKFLASAQRGGGTLTLWENQMPSSIAFEDAETTVGRHIGDTLEIVFSEGTLAQPSPGFMDRDGFMYAHTNREAVRHPFSETTGAELRIYACAIAEASGPNEVRFKVTRMVSNDILILQAAFPGWVATWQGTGGIHSLERHTPISSRLRVLSPIAAGTTITAHYRPYAFRTGLFISLLGLCALAIVTVRKHGLTRPNRVPENDAYGTEAPTTPL